MDREPLGIEGSLTQDFRLLAAYLPDGVVAVLDEDMRVLMVGGEAVGRLRLEEAVVGNGLADALGAEAMAALEAHSEELRQRRRVGTDLPLPAGVLHVSLIPIDRGGSRSWLMVGTDVTRQRAQEEAVRVSEERLKSVFEHALVGIYRTTPQGEIIMANPALVSLLGCESFEELRKRNLNTEGFDSRTPRQVFLERIDREGVVQGMESTWTRTDGEVIHIRDSATAIKDPSGRTLYYEGTVEDVTEIVRYQKRIEELNQSLRVINSILRHDIMNDLNVAIGSLELYRRRGDPRYLEATDRSMRKCATLIAKMRELESILSSSALRPMSARDVLGEVLGAYSSVPVEIQVEGEGLLMADEAVVPALDNVISNAIVHGRSDRLSIQVCQSEDRRWCDLRISDQGRGVPEEVKDLIFQEGFRYGETGNTGLGLYIVKKTMERFGGDVHVEDNQPTGAVFVLRFRSPAR